MKTRKKSEVDHRHIYDFVLIDWTSAGTAPRVISFGMLVWAAEETPGRVEVIVGWYREHVELEAEELDRLPDSIRSFFFIPLRHRLSAHLRPTW